VCEAFICKAFKGAAVAGYCKALITRQMGVLDSPEGWKRFEKLNKEIFGTNCHLTNRSKIINKKLFSLLIKRSLENFHEIFGLWIVWRYRSKKFPDKRNIHKKEQNNNTKTRK
jgi:hypothetical protein